MSQLDNEIAGGENAVSPGLAHILELTDPRFRRFLNRPLRQWAYLTFATTTFRNLFLTFFFNWYMIFTQPINAIFLLTVFPTIIVALFVLEIALNIFMNHLGGSKLIKEWSDEYGGGLSIINWGKPDLFTSPITASIVQRGLTQLTHPPKPMDPANATVPRKFNLSIAHALLLLAAVIYERDDEAVVKAFKIAQNLDSPFGDNEQDRKADKEKIQNLLRLSDSKIKGFAEKWGLTFESLSDLKSESGGPFVGLFVKETSNFIILAFKGTTPTDYSEFLVDATIQRADARPFVFGDIHEGFYNSLFPATGHSSDVDMRNPYGIIMMGVRAAATRLRLRNGGKPIHLWITGHSLGAAMGSVLFARLLKCPGDLGDGIILRDTYCFGTPAIGSNDFAAEFASYTNNTHTTINPTSSLWRVINSTDIISHLPVANDDPSFARFLDRDSFFNYAHIGIAVTLLGGVRKPVVNASVFQSSVEVEVVLYEEDSSAPSEIKITESTSKETKADGKPTPVMILERLYPSFFHNHFPRLYHESLHGAYVALENGNKDKKST